MNVLVLGLGLLLCLAAMIGINPRVGKWLVAVYAILVIAVLIWSAITGELMRPTGMAADAEEGCSYLRVC